MAHDGTGKGWDTAAPANSDLIPDGPKEIRDLRLGVGFRSDKEHKALATKAAASTAGTDGGGEHLKGSARAYYQSAAPTTTPNSETLGTGDDGRLFVDSDDDILWVWNASSFDKVVAGLIDDGAVSTAAKLASNVVITAKILDANVTAVKLATDVAGDGLGTTAGVLNVNVDDSSIETNADTLRVKAAGITVAMLSAAAKSSYIEFREEQTSGTNGGTFTQDAWTKRTLNQTRNPNSVASVSLASSVITLPDGSYEVDIIAPAHDVHEHKIRLAKTSGTPDNELLVGQSADTSGGSQEIQTNAHLRGHIVLADGTNTLEVQHYCIQTGNTTGLGQASSIPSTVEIYTIAIFRKVA